MVPFVLMLVGGSEDAVRPVSHLSIPVFPRLSSLHCRVFRPQLHSEGHVLKVRATMLVEWALANHSAQPSQRSSVNLNRHILHLHSFSHISHGLHTLHLLNFDTEKTPETSPDKPAKHFKLLG